MTIDIDKYIDFIEREQYIIYHKENYSEVIEQTRGRWESAYKGIFNRSMGNLAKQATSQQAKALRIQEQLESKGENAQDILALMDELEYGNELENILSSIAETLNNALDKAYQENDFETLLTQGGDYSNIFEQGRATSQQISEFFNLVLQGITQLTNGKVPRGTFAQLTQIGKKLGPSSYRFTNPGIKVASVTEEQTEIINRVLDYLRQAANKISGNKKISSTSFRSTITNIFSGAIGESISKDMLSSILQDVDGEVMSELSKVGVKVNKKSEGFQNVGTQQTNRKVNKVDLINSDAFQLTVNINGRDVIVEIGASTSVKWYQGIAKGGTSPIKLVSGSTMGQVIDRFGETHAALPGYTYNIFSHNWVDSRAYKGMRSAIAASFLNEWISGTGEVNEKGQINKAQFLMVNGKLYSVLDIIRRICQEDSQYGDTSFARISIQGGQGKKIIWENQKKGEVPRDAGRRRSDKARKVINALSISATLNPNMLNKYLT